MIEDIKYLDRETGEIVSEDVYGEKWLRFIYETTPGKITLWFAVKRAWFSNWYGRKMSRASSASKIIPFIEKYKLNPDEFLSKPATYKSFNDFFSRKLKEESRPVDLAPSSVVFPADGRHLGFQDVSKIDHIFAKGQKFDLVSLFGSNELAKPYLKGTLVISRLCPVDYHRFHFPVEGNVTKPTLLNGFLYSVNPIALSKRIGIFWENKRFLSFIKNSPVGNVATFLIGATCVGSVKTSCTFPSIVKKGDEYGYFLFGGSCVITIFEEGKVSLKNDLLEATQRGMELYAKMGQVLGNRI